MLCHVARLSHRVCCYFLPNPHLTCYFSLPDHDFSCYVIVARHLPDMFCPCDQISTTHITSLWPDYHVTDYVTLTRPTTHNFAILTSILSRKLFYCSQMALNYSIAVPFIFLKYFFIEDVRHTILHVYRFHDNQKHV